MPGKLSEGNISLNSRKETSNQRQATSNKLEAAGVMRQVAELAAQQ
jgi:hypothetical protein